MASVLECRRAYGKGTTTLELNGPRKHTLVWRAITNTAEMTSWQVIQGSLGASPDPIPNMFDLFPGDPLARCKSLDAKQSSESTKLWEITAHFDTQFDATQQQQEILNPLQRSPVYSVEFSQFQRVIERDMKGDLIGNSLDQAFVPAMEQEDSRPVLVVQKNMATLAEVIGFMLYFKDAVNDRPFYGAKRRQAKIKSITAGTAQMENNVSFYSVTIRIEFKGDEDAGGPTWDRQVLNTAMTFYTSWTSPLTNKVHGVQVTEPQAIDADGILIPRDPDTHRLTGDPHYLTFQTNPERNFGLLKI